MDKNLIKTSKFLSYVLRHRPDEIGIVLDESGWVAVDALIAEAAKANVELTIELLQEIVASSDKQRFALSDDGLRIRANQGHSLEVDLNLPPTIPPDTLFHGTAISSVVSIRQHGLLRRSRQHVHLSPDETTAIKVGQRHGKPAVLRVRAGEMHRGGMAFYRSANGVWLTDHVPPQFIEFPLEQPSTPGDGPTT